MNKIGTKKKTWEVCAENSIHTYRIDYNPRYANIVAEMRANMRRKDRESAAATVVDPREPDEQNETRMEEKVGNEHGGGGSVPDVFLATTTVN